MIDSGQPRNYLTNSSFAISASLKCFTHDIEKILARFGKMEPMIDSIPETSSFSDSAVTTAEHDELLHSLLPSATRPQTFALDGLSFLQLAQ
jgi:hypothetical protein